MNQKMKKLISVFLSLLLIIGVLGNTTSAKAEEMELEDSPIIIIDNMDEFESKAKLSWNCTLSSTVDDEMVYAYGKFTLPEDSYVNITNSKTIPSNAYASPEIFIYSNQDMTVEKMHFDRYDDQKSCILKAGTYYIKAEDSKLMLWKHSVVINLSIGAIPLNKLLSVNTSINKTKNVATITVNEGLCSSLKNIQYTTGKISTTNLYNSKYWITKSYMTDTPSILLKSGNTFKVKKNGTYTVRIEDTNNQAYSISFTVKGLDTTAPTITGVKNGSIYKKAVTIKYKDSGTGIKKATLNGKTIKTNKKVSAKGKYTLKVTDKAGNVRTVKFTIK